MDLEWVPVFLISVIAGGVAAGTIHAFWKMYDVAQRAKQLKRADGVAKVRGTVLDKEHYTTTHRSGKHGRSTTHHYKISYEFETDDAKVRVAGREITQAAWERYARGDSVDVVYLAGHPESCRLKDMVEIDEGGLGRMKCAACFALIFLCIMIFQTWEITSVFDHSGGQRIQMVILAFFAFFGSCGLGSVSSYYSHVERQSTDNIYGGQVIVTELESGSEEEDNALF